MQPSLQSPELNRLARQPLMAHAGRMFHFSQAPVKITPVRFVAMALVLALNTSSGADAPAPKRKEKNSSPAPSHRVLRDLAYASPGGKPLLLDLHLPEKGGGPWPVVVWVHGGGWNAGSKEKCPATWLVTNGFAVASINYRLTQEAQWPAQIEDCRAAVRWLRTNAKQHQLDPDHMGAWGSSAGGHLVALMGTLPLPGDEEVSSRVQAVCDWFGPSDLLTMPPNVVGNGRTEADVAKSNGAKLLGAPVKDVPDKSKQASAFHQVSKDDAPFLIMHGDADPGVPLEQSEKLAAALKAAGVPVTLEVIKGGGHGGPAFNTPELRQSVLAFFEKWLRPGSQTFPPGHQ